jgi:CBS domain-containing protein
MRASNIEASSNAPAASTRAFLRSHPPFDRFSEDTLAFAIPRLSLAYFAKETVILTPASGPVTHLHIIRRGVIGSRPEDPLSASDPPLGPGELFPIGALSAGGASTQSYYAIQDTFCFRLARDDFLELRKRSPEFERYCTHAVAETLKQALAQIHSHFGQFAVEQQTLARPLRELIRRAPISCGSTAPLFAALALMNERNVRTLAVVDTDGQPVGMLTLVDILRRVVLPQLPLTTPVAEVMSKPVVALPATASAYQALQTMAERMIRQICVVDGGSLVGIVNERDLFALSRVSMRQVQDGLRVADSIDLLKSAATDIAGLTRSLLAQGVAAEPLTHTITALNDALTRRAIELTLARHDVGETAWCWLALGSEGRGEQTFSTDQDNALVFVPHADAAVESERARLIAFARDVNAALAMLGFPLCTGNVMAGNPELCLTLDEWKRKFLKWLTVPTPEALLRANILFDFRPLYGDTALCDALRDWLYARTPDANLFLRLMAQNALEATPPLGLLRAFAVDDDREHRGTFDLKTRGTRLFVDAARVFALAFAIRDTGTARRLRNAARRLNLGARQVEATVDAFHFLQVLRLRQQDLTSAPAAANRVAPDALNEIDRRMLKEAFRQARLLQQQLKDTWQL